MMIDAGNAFPSLDTQHRFSFTAAFTGMIGSLGVLRFHPMVRIEQGAVYDGVMDVTTGATTITQRAKNE